jgi:hypothetical protein
MLSIHSIVCLSQKLPRIELFVCPIFFAEQTGFLSWNEIIKNASKMF